MFKPKPYIVPVIPASCAIQGQPGSFSHTACSAMFNAVALHCFDTFDDAFDSVASGQSELGVIPIENTIAGKVPYVHKLIRDKGLNIIGEYFLPIQHCLVTLPGVNLLDVKIIHSHMHALAQCRGYLSRHRDQFETRTNADTAGAAKLVSELQDPTQAAISPAFAAHTYGLDISQRGIQDNKSNITRFIVAAKTPISYPYMADQHYITTVVLKPKRARDFPLLDILTTLKDNGLRYSSIEEYSGKDFWNEGFYVEIVGHTKGPRMQAAIAGLRKISSEIEIIGLYPTHHFQRFPKRVSQSSPDMPAPST